MRWLVLALLLTGCSPGYVYRDSLIPKCPTGTYPVQSIVGPACVDNSTQYMGALTTEPLEVPMRLRMGE